MSLSKMKALIADLPKGPLDVYRKRATIDWKLLKLKLEGEDGVEFQRSLWSHIQKNPIFRRKSSMTLDEERRICNSQMRAMLDNDILHPINNALMFNTLFQYNGSLPIKAGLTIGMVPKTLWSLGSERHHEIASKVLEGEYYGCFALTEISHGTNAKAMRTEARYDKGSKSFILHTPDFEAAKCWVGGLGKAATHAVVFAQLITPDGVNHGLHTFIVPIRDPKTHLPYPGVTVADMGEKIGLNGIDNGFLLFDNYRIPREYLLNRTADVSEDGEYTATVKDKNKRFGASLGALSGGRVVITQVCANYATVAMVIAVRYCAARRQFGPDEKEEWPVLEYQAQQWRLFPHLAATYAMKTFSLKLMATINEFHARLISRENSQLLSDQGMELHALSSAAKPLCSWTTRDLIQDCRESCGGHGYLKMSRLGELRADNDANCTYEGENNVLVQQASNWLVNQYANFLDGKRVISPLGSADFITDSRDILSKRFTCTTIKETVDPEHVLFTLKWLVCYYLKATHGRVQKLRSKGLSDFETRNDSQTFFAHTLSLLYAQYAVLKSFMEFVKETDFRPQERDAMLRLCSLYGAAGIEKRLGDLYMGGYARQEDDMGNMLREGIIGLCNDLLPDAVALVDVLAPPDFILNSPLGMADGEVYKHMKEWMYREKENFERPAWWKEIKSKL